MRSATVRPRGSSRLRGGKRPATRAAGLATVAMMALAGCGDGGSDPGDDVQAVAAEAEADAGTDTDADREEEDADPGAGSGDDNQPDDAEDDADASGEEAGDDAAAAVMALADRQVEGTVMLNGFEITVRDLTATDLDLEASPDGEVDRRSMGIELLFDVDVFNPTSGPGAPGSPVSMRWDEPDTGNVYDVRADLEVRDVPSNNSGSGQLVVVVPPDGLERFDEASHSVTADDKAGALRGRAFQCDGDRLHHFGERAHFRSATGADLVGAP